MAYVGWNPLAVEARPTTQLIGNASVLGGQFRFERNSPSSGALASLTLSPVVSFSDRRTLVPIYAFNYRGFRDVLDVIGGGTLFQQTLENQGVLKWVEQFDGGRWAVKPFVSFKSVLYRETTNEDWGKGLFDYNRVGTGGNATRRLAEQGYIPRSVGMGYAFYSTTYPNFRSLASQFGREFDVPQPGSKVLNNQVHQGTLESEWRMTPKVRADASLLFSRRSFSDQRIVQEDDSFSRDTRTDRDFHLEFGGVYLFEPLDIRPDVRVGLSVRLGYSLDRRWSNQNHFDADIARLKFIPNFYDFIQQGISVTTQWVLAPWPVNLSARYTFERRNYSDRLIQNQGGAYGTDPIHQNSHVVTTNLSYRLWKGLNLRIVGNVRDSTSNTQFERFFRYNFKSASYFGGMTYEF
ncbi:MAG: hypothetical protein HYZ73_03540 [Elusimicrobia bacterium]|nr:hypothetical protein [Elusimicrobiota bacterium]